MLQGWTPTCLAQGCGTLRRSSAQPRWEVHPKGSTATAGVPHQPCPCSPARTQMLNQLTGLLEACEHLSLNLSSTVSTRGDEWIKLQQKQKERADARAGAMAVAPAPCSSRVSRGAGCCSLRVQPHTTGLPVGPQHTPRRVCGG